jgi:hypothetical protein
MFFWAGLVVVLVVAGCLIAWGARGMRDREHQPGTRHLD